MQVQFKSPQRKNHARLGIQYLILCVIIIERVLEEAVPLPGLYYRCKN